MIAGFSAFGVVICIFMIIILGWPALPLLFLLVCVIDWSGDGNGRQWGNNND